MLCTIRQAAECHPPVGRGTGKRVCQYVFVILNFFSLYSVAFFLKAIFTMEQKCLKLGFSFLITFACTHACTFMCIHMHICYK